MSALAEARRLDEPIVDDGIRWLNYFNGRVLSAEDMTIDHEAIDRARSQLGHGIGRGVIGGFSVAEAQASNIARPVLTVTAGLAINDAGVALELRRAVSIGLVRVDATEDEVAGFAPCDVILRDTTGRGVYLLAVGSAEVPAGKATVAGLGNDDPSCNVAYTVEGVRFRLYPVDLEPGDLDAPELLRNIVAYRMYGAADPRRLRDVNEPFSARDDDYGELDDLRRSCLDDDEVPLATLHWQPGEGLKFVDMWSVRRRAVRVAVSTAYATPLDDRCETEGDAMVLQFEDHVVDLLVREASPATLRAVDRFRYLPPVGILPLTIRSGRGFVVSSFFDGTTIAPPAHIEGAHLPGLLRDALTSPPIDLESHEAIRLYFVRQDAQRAGTADREATASCVVFASGHLRYLADARFDLAYFNYANYAQV